MLQEIASNKMNTKIRYYSSVGYNARYSVNVAMANTDWSPQWISETLLRDCIRDYFKNE